MMISNNFDTDVQKLSRVLASLISEQSDRRDRAFGCVNAALSNLLRELECHVLSADEYTSTAETLSFIAMARIYLRALATYPSQTDEWLHVFCSLRTLFDAHMVRTGHLLAADQCAKNAATELERLRQNPRLVLRAV